ncbi:MAG: trigger factor, partial [Alphaproteobacteria bacterium]
MQVTETKNEGLEREFSIKVDAAEIDTKVTSRLDELKNTVQIPGFRPGKIPESLMRKK